MEQFKSLGKMTIQEWKQIRSLMLDGCAHRLIALDNAIVTGADKSHIEWLREDAERAKELFDSTAWYAAEQSPLTFHGD